MRGWWLLLPAVACKGGDGDATDTTVDGVPVGDDDDDDDAPWPNTCTSVGPDAPNPGPVPDEDVAGTFEGFATYVWIPEHTRGLVVYLHGGADVAEIAQTEPAFLFTFLYTEGFGLVATQRTGPGPEAMWDTTPSIDRNADAARIERLLAQVRADHGLPDDVPIVTAGFSDGAIGAMALARIGVDEGWPVVASLVHSGAYSTQGSTVPTLLLTGENDNPQSPQQVVDQLTRQGVRAEWIEQPERLAEPETFLRNPSWDLAKGQEAVDDLVALGMIDASGARLVPDANLDQALRLYGENSTFMGATLTEARLRVLWATHRVSAYSADEECRFILDSL
jgi:hypothetical protein